MPEAKQAESFSLWRPLRHPGFRNLLLADVVSDVGTFMQNVGAAWLMVSLNAGPMYVALTQTASSLPFFLFALPAGAVGDIVDRRKLILFTEAWMVAVAVLLTLLTFGGVVSPLPLLLLTFALSAGDAFETPTWRAVLPEIVPREDLPAASALNGIEFNFARAIGPGLAGLVIAVSGVGSAFLINTLSFVGVIVVIARWKRPARTRSTPPETLVGATIAAVRYVRYSPAIRSLLVRSGALMFFASGLLALLPSVAHSVNSAPTAYGLLLGCFGAGAVGGAVLMQRARRRWSAEAVVAGGVAAFGLTAIAAASSRSLFALGSVLLLAGAAWIVFVSTVNVLILNHTPDWVRARVLAIATLVQQGAVAAGSAVWGTLAARASIGTALQVAGVGALATIILALFVRLPEASVDLSSWNHWRLPESAQLPPGTAGPVLVTVEYEVPPTEATAFIKAARQFERVRRRDGAKRWNLYRDLERPNRYLETYVVSSWSEHVRQHERITRADREIEERVQKYVVGEPTVRHHISASD